MPDLTVRDLLLPVRNAARRRYAPYQEGVTDRDRALRLDSVEDFGAGAEHVLRNPIILRTAEELAALPVGSVVLDGLDRAYVRSDLREGWSWVAHDGYAATHDGLALAASGPVELIRLPRDEEGT